MAHYVAVFNFAKGTTPPVTPGDGEVGTLSQANVAKVEADNVDAARRAIRSVYAPSTETVIIPADQFTSELTADEGQPPELEPTSEPVTPKEGDTTDAEPATTDAARADDDGFAVGKESPEAK